MDDVPEHEGVVEVTLQSLVVVGEVGLPAARKGVHYLRSGQQYLRLHDDERRLVGPAHLLLVVIDSQCIVVLLGERANYPDHVALLGPQLVAPATNGSQPEEERTLHEVAPRGRPQVVDGRTQLQLYVFVEVLLLLNELNSEQFICKIYPIFGVSILLIVGAVCTMLRLLCLQLVNFLEQVLVRSLHRVLQDP